MSKEILKIKQDIGDPYLDIPGNPKYDWYTANVHEESEWQHTNFDPFSSWSNMPSPIGNCTINYYKYNFSNGHRENNADTYVIEVAIPISLLESSGAIIWPGETTIGAQWSTGCRNEGVKAAGISKVLELEGVNIADVKATGDFSQQYLEDSDFATAIATYPPILNITKEGLPNPLLVNQTLQYIITYENIGYKTANNVYVNDTLDNNTNIISASGIYSTNGKHISWYVGDLAPDGPHKLYLNVSINQSVVNGITLTVMQTPPIM